MKTKKTKKSDTAKATKLIQSSVLIDNIDNIFFILENKDFYLLVVDDATRKKMDFIRFNLMSELLEELVEIRKEMGINNYQDKVLAQIAKSIRKDEEEEKKVGPNKYPHVNFLHLKMGNPLKK